MNPFVHSLAIVTPVDTEEDDEMGTDIVDEVPEEVMGLVQPRSTTEIEQSNQVGALLADHVVFLPLRELSNNAYIRYEPDDGDRYEILGVRLHRYGRLPHLEVDTRRIRGDELVAGS